MSSPILNSPSERELAYWLALHLAPGVGARTFLKLLDRFGHPRAVLEHARADWGLAAETLTYLSHPDWAAVEHALTWAGLPDNHLLTLQDPAYPERLKQIPDPPPVLYVRGGVQLLSSPQLAVVGSRNPSPIGLHNAFEFSRYIAMAGLVITSGLALGIDGAAHRGALAAPGATIAVAGTGIDQVYPARHRELAEQIVGQGALVSELPLGTPPAAAHFPRRNRIISGLSLGVLVVEAAPSSGSLITARLAAEQGREVFAIPGSIHHPLAHGCHALIREGAKLVETGHDILDELHPLAAIADTRPPAARNAADGFTVEVKKVLENMGFDAVPVDLLVDRTGLTPETVSSILLLLELQGVVSSTVGGLYVRLPKRV